MVYVNEQREKREDFIKKLLVILLEDQENVAMTEIKEKWDKTV